MERKLRITVNGTAYDVTVEDLEKSWDRQLKAAAKKYTDLAKR